MEEIDPTPRAQVVYNVFSWLFTSYAQCIHKGSSESQADQGIQSALQSQLRSNGDANDKE